MRADAPWPDAESAALARDACYSCHSNETDWPLYSYVAPMSWLVRADVESGRDELNFSDWDEALRTLGVPTKAEVGGEQRRITSP